MELVNLTPHDIVIALPSGERITIPASGNVARIANRPGQQLLSLRVQDVDVPVYGPDIKGDIYGLPDPKDGTVYLVSLLVAQACPERQDLLVPATGPMDETIRDTQGRIEAVSRLKFGGLR